MTGKAAVRRTCSAVACMVGLAIDRTVNEQAVGTIAVLATEHVCASIKRVNALVSTAARSHAHAIFGGFASLHTENFKLESYQSD